MHDYKIIKDRLINDRKSGKRFAPADYKSDLNNVAEQFRRFVATYSASPYTIPVLSRMAAVMRIQGNFDELSAYMQGIAHSPELQHLKPYALNALISMYINKEEDKKSC